MAPIPEDEKSPQIANVPGLIERLSAQKSEIVDSTIKGFVGAFDANDEVGKEDHPQGITVTPRGRIVVNMSRNDGEKPSDHCGGVLMYSDPFAIGKDLSWNTMCGLARHPSAMQAVGDIVAVAETSGTRFFKLPAVGQQQVRELDIRCFDDDKDYSKRFCEGKFPGGESVGITFHGKEDRYYAFVSGGSLTPQPVDIEMCRTSPGRSLQSDTTCFSECRTIKGVYASSQGSHLVTSTTGELYVISTFSSDAETEDVSATGATGNDAHAEYVTKCGLETVGAIAGGYDVKGNFRDIVTLTLIDFNSGRAWLRFKKDLVRTQRTQVCVQDRPAWRFGGAVAPVFGNPDLLGPSPSIWDNGALMALWSGRFYTISDPFSDDDYEFAYQRLGLPNLAACVSDDECGAQLKCLKTGADKGVCMAAALVDNPCKCDNSGEWGTLCGDWDASGFKWCYVKDPKACQSKILTKGGGEKYWMKC